MFTRTKQKLMIGFLKIRYHRHSFDKQLKTFCLLIISFVTFSSFLYSFKHNEINCFGSLATIRPDTVEPNSGQKLVGLWEAKRIFGSGIGGQLLIKENKGVWSAEIDGHFVQAKLNDEAISFELPGEMRTFKGNFETQHKTIVGFWFQSAPMTSGVMALPVTLTKKQSGIWEGQVVPYPDEMTFYLMVKMRADGSLGAFLRNPERNIGWVLYPVNSIEVDGNVIRLFAANKGGNKGKMLAEGKYDADWDRLSIYLPRRGGTYDFSRVTPGGFSNFYPRGFPSVRYKYMPPVAYNDGWKVGTLEDVGISRDSIERFIQMIIDTPIDSIKSQEDHGIIIARHGKIVLEEYFHGENRNKPHDTRSAGKSIASDLMGASILSGVKISPSDYVYKIMNGGQFPDSLEQRKRSLTVKNLLTMSSGFDCDDNDPNSPGFEDNMWEQTEQPDFYKWTMNLKMIREPGEKAVYCSANANLVGGVVSKVANQPAAILFHKLIAEPLGIKQYYLLTSPHGDFTITGSARFLPRDFMKLGQLHLNGGTWNGHKIYTPEWSKEATTPLYDLPNYKQSYGYLWWVTEFPYNGRNVKAYCAEGNGGQKVIVIPELDMVIAFYAGNYSDSGGWTSQRVYVPKYILPAVKEGR